MSDLEEHTLEPAGDRCEECGARLTATELHATLETGGPALCSVHAAENTTNDPDEVDVES